MEERPLDISQVLSDEELKVIPSEEKLSRLNNLCKSQFDLENKINELEQRLEDTKKELAKVSEHSIPELMDEIGISEFRMTNGLVVRVAPFFTGDTKDPESLIWLEENGHSDIIKGSITIPYPKGYDQDKLQAIAKVAEGLGLPVDNREEVHHSTIRSWIRDMIKSGSQFPKELFHVYVGRRTKLTLK